MMHTLLGGSQWSGLVTYQTGTPFSVVDGLYGPCVGNTLSTRDEGAGSYLNIIGDPYSRPTVTGRFPVSSVRCSTIRRRLPLPLVLTFGNAQRNVLNSPSRTISSDSQAI
jgi:hypothetical protein